jgi:ABC-type oligopeptide transport system substrate-binding subunit
VEQPHRTILALASMLLLAVLLSGCGLPWPFPQPTPDPKLPDAQQILRPLASGPNAGDIDTFDPGQIQFGFDYDKAQMIYPELITLTDDLKPIDWAAKSHEVSSDGLSYTFHLNSGMKWSDGTAIDANTFAYAINRSLDPCFASGVSYYNLNIKGATDYNSKTCDAATTTDEWNGLDTTAKTALIGKSIVVADPLTLKVTIEAPAAYFLSKMSYPTFWGVPQQLIAKYGQTKWTDHLTDNGPFGGNLYLLQNSPTALGSLIFERNERFWGNKPLLRRIEYTLYGDGNVLWQDFAQGQGDIASIPSAQYATAQAMTGITVQQTPMLVYWYLRLNWQLAPFDDVRVRHAFSLALDRNALALQGTSFSQTILPPETIRAYRQPTIHLVLEGLPGYNPDLTDAAGRSGKDALTPDLDAARSLARAYAAERCGGDYAKCPPITIPRPTRSPSSANVVAEAVLDQARRAFPGWVIQIEEIGGVELKVFPPLQVLLDAWGADYPDPQDFLSLLWTTNPPYPYGSAASHVSVPQVDALLSQADGMNDQSARIPLYQLAEQLLVNQGAAVPLYQPLQNDAVRSRVSGWRVAPTLQTPLSVWQTAYLRR